MSLRFRLGLIALFFLAWSPGCGRTEPPGPGAKRTVAVIPKGTTQVYWRTVEAGARKAGEELGVDIVWKSPLRENDRAMQISLVEQFVTEGVAGIVLAPLDDTALVRPVRSAASKGIPVVIFDSDLNAEVGKDFISFVATDNVAGGRLAGKHLSGLLGGKGKVGVLRFQVGSASTTQREQGFLEAIREQPGLEVVLENQYGGATSGETIQKAEELLDVLRSLDGLFCPNESTTYGMLVALRKHNLVGKLKFVGFDSSEDLLRGLETSELDALVVQNPRKMAYVAVKALVDHLDGKTVPQRVDTGVHLVTRENLSDPEVKALVAPTEE